jgi:hypothetical protein
MTLAEIRAEFELLEWDLRITLKRLDTAYARHDYATVNDMEKNALAIRERITHLRKAIAVLDAKRMA